MMAKGLDKKQAQQLIVRGYIERTRESLLLGDSVDEKEQLIGDIMDYLHMN